MAIAYNQILEVLYLFQNIASSIEKYNKSIPKISSNLEVVTEIEIDGEKTDISHFDVRQRRLFALNNQDIVNKNTSLLQYKYGINVDNETVETVSTLLQILKESGSKYIDCFEKEVDYLANSECINLDNAEDINHLTGMRKTFLKIYRSAQIELAQSHDIQVEDIPETSNLTLIQ